MNSDMYHAISRLIDYVNNSKFVASVMVLVYILSL
jgi:hypothetical protein